MDYFVSAVNLLSSYTIPVIFLIIIGYAMLKRIRLYESFVEGGKEGWEIFLKILPYIVAILVAIGVFRASGALDSLAGLLSPLTNLIGMPPETLPVALMKPLSGSGSLGLAAEVIANAPDSFEARVASTMFGATDTTFYIIALYFGSVGIRKIRHAMVVGLTADLAGILAAVGICHIMFPPN